ncbi:MAG: hypothetical protein WCG78_06880, partial [Candidatus Omnitrophota bacterium]
ITIDGGPMFKRFRAGSMGRAMTIRHRTSHILLELDAKKAPVKKSPSVAVDSQSKKSKEQKAKAPKTTATEKPAHKESAAGKKKPAAKAR